MPRLAASSWESNDDASYRPACERIINCVQLPPWSSPCGHAIHLCSGRAGDLATRMYARKGPASALPTLLAEHPSSRATSSASPSVSASQRYPLLFGALQRADSSAATRVDYAGHFAHAALQPVKAYVPRSSLHAQIYAQLSRDAADSGTRKLVVWGLGGAGKTQLVLDYVQQHRTEYKATFWIEAGRKESLERDFVRLYQTLLGLHTSAGTEAVSVEDAVTGVKSWFAGQQGRWLMVFDGADTIEDGDAREYINIVHFFPDAAALDVIITSRSSTARDMTRLEGVQVGEMEAAQAAELFQKYARISRDDATVPDEVLAIVNELGCLALAVTLAATYVGSTPRLQSNIKAYLPEYRQRRRELLRRKPESMVHQYSESVLTTWETSYAAAAGQCVEAIVLMTVLCFLSFDDIYLELFRADTLADGPEQTEGEGDASWRSLVSPQQALDVYKIEECFAALQKYSLVQWKADQKSYAIHKLVHAWGCDRLTAEEQSKYSQAAFDLVIEAVEAVEGYSRGPEDKLRLVPHVMGSFQALTDVGNRSNQVTEALVDKLESVGEFVTDLGRWPEARAVKKYVLQARRRLLGEEHPDTISAMGNLAITLGDQGQLEEAAEIEREVLEKRTQILGKEHPDTISAMSNLAVTLGEQGQLEEAAEIEREVLEKRTQILGKEHPDTISAMSNLAETLREQGQLEEAAIMQKEVLEKRTQILGKEHPDTILAMSNLAITLRKQGHLDRTAEIEREVLEKRRRILGKEHPRTISAMNNLADTLREQGQLEEAAIMQKEVLEKQTQILGKEHPDTISAMSNLAITLGKQGQPEEAAIMQKEVLEKRTQILGKEHPNTISVMSNLAITLGEQGQLEEAAIMQKEVLEKRTQILGKEHPETISAMNNLADTLRKQGQLEEAAIMQKEVLEKQTQILGKEHPRTISAINNLADMLREQGQLEEAAIMQKEVLEKRTEILSEEHPNTISAISNLAITLGEQGQLEEAAIMQKEVLEKRRRILGEEHPDTISAMSNLAITLREQGQLEEAAVMRKELLEKRTQILGKEHPDTISAMSNLAITLREQGQLEEAAVMQKEVLEKRTQILGKEHPNTILAISNLAVTLREQGQLEEAAIMQKEVVEKRTQILGEEHPDTISAMSNLAITLGEQGYLDRTAEIEREVLEKRRRILGEEHPDTISAMNNLDITLRQQAQLHQEHSNTRRPVRSPVRPIESSSVIHAPLQSPRRKRIRVFAYIRSKLQK